MTASSIEVIVTIRDKDSRGTSWARQVSTRSNLQEEELTMAGPIHKHLIAANTHSQAWRMLQLSSWKLSAGPCVQIHAQ